MVLVDTGVVFGATDADDPRHADCAAVWEAYAGELGIVVPVIVESAWLIESRLGPAAEAEFLASLAEGEVTRVELADEDWVRVAGLVGDYADLGLGVVDASIVAVAERLRITTVATLDRRHFSVVRPAHLDAFELVP